MAEVAKKVRVASKRFFTRAENALSMSLTPEAVEDTIRRRFDELYKRWDQVQTSHDTYISSLGNLDEDEIQYEEPKGLMARRGN